MSDDAVERAIARYRDELRAEADLGATELDEIADHLRTLTEDLRADGLPAIDAVTEAARRLGAPAKLARELARVHEPLGARISRVRAWSAVLLLAPWVATLVFVPYMPTWFKVATAALLLGLASRQGWARIFVLVFFAARLVAAVNEYFLVIPAHALAYRVEHMSVYVLMDLVIPLGVVALLMPWRRRELSARGLAFAAAIWLWHVAGSVGVENAWMDFPPWGAISEAAALAAALGCLLRARWSAVAIVVAVAAMLPELARVMDTETFGLSPAWRHYEVALAATGVVAAIVGATLAWRTARSTIGQLPVRAT